MEQATPTKVILRKNMKHTQNAVNKIKPQGELPTNDAVIAKLKEDILEGMRELARGSRNTIIDLVDRARELVILEDDAKKGLENEF
jgi:hypothetical protein